MLQLCVVFLSSIALLMVCLALGTNGYKTYQDKIPNGNAVPHPCKPNYTWKGVGHQNVGRWIEKPIRL